MPPRANLPPGKGKRVPLNMRTTLELRDRVAKAAADSGRSLVQEVETRLESTFLQEDVIAREFGGREATALFRMMGAAAELIEATSGKKWLEDWNTSRAVLQAWKAIWAIAAPALPKKFVEMDKELDAATSWRLTPLPRPPVPPSGLRGSLMHSDSEEQAAYDRARTDWQENVKAYEAELGKREKQIAKLRKRIDRFRKQELLATIFGNEAVEIVRKRTPARSRR